MAQVNAFYDRKNFFGGFVYGACDDNVIVTDEEDLKEKLKMCFSAFGKKYGFSFRVDFSLGDKYTDRYLVEHYCNESPSIYHVTHAYSQSSNDNPKIMTRRDITKLMLAILKEETKKMESDIQEMTENPEE